MKQVCTNRVPAILLAVLKKRIFSFCLLVTVMPSFLCAQSGSSSSSSSTVTSELVFQSPILVSGTAGQDGAVYKFKNVVSGIDATVKIVGRSSNDVNLKSIDTVGIGWSKAFQPVLGIQNGGRYQNWWMEFQLRFYVSNTSTYKKLQSFQATAIDVDGDGQSLQEYLQMQRTKSDAYSSLCYLTKPSTSSCLTSYSGEDVDDNNGNDRKILGPTQNFGNIDTAGTAVMASFTYENKDMIVFRYGATTGSSGTSVGERLNSLWFKAFSLAPQRVLPLQLTSFQGNVNNNKANLQWTVAENETGYSFELEKSFDGVKFSTDALIFTTSKAGVENYSYKESIDRSSYYRLRMINKDNSISYSKIIRLAANENSSNNNIKILQNPVGSSLQFSYSIVIDESTTVNIYSGTGVKMLSKQVQSQKGNNTYMLNLDAKMSKGIYLLEITNGSERSITKFIKE